MTLNRRSPGVALLMMAITCLCVATIVQSECIEGDEQKLVSKTARSNLYTGEQKFTLNMLRVINQSVPQENVFFSPYSTYHALLLAYFGSQGQTEKELRDVLELGWASSKYEVFQAYRYEKSSRQTRFKESPVVFKSVDKIYVSKSEKFE